MLFGLISSVRRAFASKLRGPGFKSWPSTVGGPVTITMWGARLKTSFEVSPVSEAKQGTFPFFFSF